MPQSSRDIVIFDLGGVLIDWDPRHLYRKLFAGDEAAMEHFLATVCTHDWNRARTPGAALPRRARCSKPSHPEQAGLIDAYGARFDEMMPGRSPAASRSSPNCNSAAFRFTALTNWSAETFPPTVARFEFLRWLRGIVVSGEVGVIKPDPRIYGIAIERYAIDPRRAVYIDDVPINAEAAVRFGIHGIHFTSATLLRVELTSLGLL